MICPSGGVEQVTVTVPTQDTATTGSIEVHDTWNTGLGKNPPILGCCL